MSRMSLPIALPIRSIRLIRAEIDAILDDMDAAAARAEKEHITRRRFPRQPCRLHNVLVRIKQAGQQPTNFLVPTRNISEGGISFLHRTMLYQDTECTVVIMLSNRRTFKSRGRVKQCRHVSGIVYEIGVEFDTPAPLDELQFFTGSDCSTACGVQTTATEGP